MGFFDRFKKSNEKDGELDILDEIKEPFSFDDFIEDQIVGRYHRIRKLLDERGILFFLMSPFQYRNRLLLKLTAIFLGVMLGIVPRTSKLISQAQEKNASSELAQIADKVFKIGRMELTALESSQYEKQHVMTFLISGETTAGVPSTVENYDIELSPRTGVMEPEKIKYTYDIIPIDNSQRMLLMYVDNREQDDDLGIFNLKVQISGDDKLKMETPLEIILSNQQETTALFDSEGLDLAILTDVFIADSSSQIGEVQEELSEKVKGFELMADRLTADGYRVATGFDYMNSHIKKYEILKDLSDETTVRGIPNKAMKSDELKGEDKQDRNLDIDIMISKGDRSYSTSAQLAQEATTDKEIKYDEDDRLAISEMVDLQKQADEVTAVLTKLNTVRQEKYDNLIDLQRTLNREIDPEKLKKSAFVAEPTEEGQLPTT